MRVIKRYRIHAGTFAWILHRLSGLGLIFYLLLHIWVISHLSGGEKSFDAVMHAFGSPLFKFLEVGLVGVILYHLFNGLRITLIDMGLLIEKQKMLYIVAVIVWLISWASVGMVMISRMVLPALG
ncbi:MAG: succinate dehydrogenase, cytochrome b556 subunit [Candidatus Krumholzibacteriota bacterium]|nr:succinate dehydrogenase, cytochrome b556 subunit [Candidatus Krumholzibacteriota bacterium]